jgi:hypothetical protein
MGKIGTGHLVLPHVPGDLVDDESGQLAGLIAAAVARVVWCSPT